LKYNTALSALPYLSEFFLRFGTGKPVINPTKELNSHQKEFELPFFCSSNARQHSDSWLL